MEAAVPWKAALRNARLPTGLGKRFAFPTSPTAPAGDTKERRSRRETHGGVKISRSLGGLILTIVGTGTQTFWSSGTYEFDGSGNIKKIGNTGYAYDPFGRLVSWTTASGNTISSVTRTLDAFGNELTSISQVCGPAGVFWGCSGGAIAPPRTIDGTTNRYDDTTYDTAGNVVLDVLQRSYTWDPLAMMTGATVDGRTFRYLYNADNERIAAVERVPVGMDLRNRTTFTLRNDSNQLLTTWTDDWTSGSSVFTRKEDTIWRGAQLLGRAAGSTTMRYTLDHLGSPRLITDDSGAVLGQQNFEPFGSGGLFGSGALQFTGHERDQANLGGGAFALPDYMHARYYDQNGSFLSVDPMLGDPRQPQSWNRYAYALNNPLRFTDPDGKLFKELWDTFVSWLTGGDKAESDRGQQIQQLADAGVINKDETTKPSTYREGLKEGISTVGSELTKEGMIAIAGAGIFRITSKINADSLLIREAERAGASSQTSLDNLVTKLASGNLNPGIGTKNVFGNIFEARAADGARVYFRQSRDGVEILAKSNKANQDKVINRLRQLYE